MSTKRTAYGMAWALLTLGSFGITAQAAVQTQAQTMYTDQSQQVSATGDAIVNQDQSSSMSSNQSQTSTQDGGHEAVSGTNVSSVQADQSHTFTGSGTFTQKQGDVVTSQENKTTTDTSTTTTMQTDTQSKQNGTTLHITDSATVGQDFAALVQTYQSQTSTPQPTSSTLLSSTIPTSAGTQSGDNSHGATTNQDPSPSVTSYLLEPLLKLQSSASPTDVAGYAVFDPMGNLLSDSYGIYPNLNNNFTRQYDSFTPNVVTPIVISAVNAWGKPLTPSSPTTVYLRTNNFNGTFVNMDTEQPMLSVVIPAGSTGVVIGYVNRGGISQFDVIDAGLDNPYAIHRPAIRAQSAGAETQQNQQVQLEGVSGTQNQTSIAMAGQFQNGGLPDSPQSQNVSQTLTSSQSQTVDTATSSQNSSINSNKSTTNADSGNQTLNVNATQTETGSTADPTNLSQNQSVTVTDAVINVTFNQTSSTTGSAVNLNQSISVTDPNSQNSSSTHVINVTMGDGSQQQLTVNSDSAITLNESQSVNTSSPGDVQQSVYVTYDAGGQGQTVTLSP